jgi:hypothetical protein
MRRSLTYIRSEFPEFEVEPGFSEEDEMRSMKNETREQLNQRAKVGLDKIFWGKETGKCNFAPVDVRFDLDFPKKKIS